MDMTTKWVEWVVQYDVESARDPATGETKWGTMETENLGEKYAREVAAERMLSDTFRNVVVVRKKCKVIQVARPLPPGRYRMEAHIKTSDGPWEEKSKVIDIEKPMFAHAMMSQFTGELHAAFAKGDELAIDNQILKAED